MDVFAIKINFALGWLERAEQGHNDASASLKEKDN